MKTMNGKPLSATPDGDQSFPKSSYDDVSRACSKFLQSRGISGRMYGARYGGSSNSPKTR